MRKIYILHSILAVLLTRMRSINGEAICTQLEYGPPPDYTPVLVKYCCPGYGGLDSTHCLPRCDMGCPPNSHCAMPNVCVCNEGYEVDQTYMYYGLETVKSCGIQASRVHIAFIQTCGLILLATLFAIVIVITRMRQRTIKGWE